MHSMSGPTDRDQLSHSVGDLFGIVADPQDRRAAPISLVDPFAGFDSLIPGPALLGQCAQDSEQRRVAPILFARLGNEAPGPGLFPLPERADDQAMTDVALAGIVASERRLQKRV